MGLGAESAVLNFAMNLIYPLTEVYDEHQPDEL